MLSAISVQDIVEFVAALLTGTTTYEKELSKAVEDNFLCPAETLLAIPAFGIDIGKLSAGKQAYMAPAAPAPPPEPVVAPKPAASQADESVAPAEAIEQAPEDVAEAPAEGAECTATGGTLQAFGSERLTEGCLGEVAGARLRASAFLRHHPCLPFVAT